MWIPGRNLVVGCMIGAVMTHPISPCLALPHPVMRSEPSAQPTDPEESSFDLVSVQRTVHERLFSVPFDANSRLMLDQSVGGPGWYTGLNDRGIPFTLGVNRIVPVDIHDARLRVDPSVISVWESRSIDACVCTCVMESDITSIAVVAIIFTHGPAEARTTDAIALAVLPDIARGGIVDILDGTHLVRDPDRDTEDCDELCCESLLQECRDNLQIDLDHCEGEANVCGWTYVGCVAATIACFLACGPTGWWGCAPCYTMSRWCIGASAACFADVIRCIIVSHFAYTKCKDRALANPCCSCFVEQ